MTNLTTSLINSDRVIDSRDIAYLLDIKHKEFKALINTVINKTTCGIWYIESKLADDIYYQLTEQQCYLILDYLTYNDKVTTVKELVANAFN